jgi:hypothetical protein
VWQSEERLSNFFNKSINYNAHHRLPPKPKAKILAAETQQWLTKAALFRYTASSYGVKKNMQRVQPASPTLIHGMRQSFVSGQPPRPIVCTAPFSAGRMPK